jgi:thioester reductase-like protein
VLTKKVSSIMRERQTIAEFTAVRREAPAGVQTAAGSALRAPEGLDAFDEMLSDAVLPEDVEPMECAQAVDHGSLARARSILLTGATGFLGRWLAKEIIDQSEATVICAVRPGRRDARTRLLEALASTGIDDKTFDRRVRLVEGDLLQTKLGLEASSFQALALEVDAICHCAATVNWALPYHALRPANVEATLDLLRLAAVRSVPFHFVSSLSVCYSTSAPSTPTEQFDALPHLRGLHLGYAQSKAVAEALVREAGRRGLPIVIYRPSFIAGHSASGAFNRDDILARVVSGCVSMRTAPDLDWILDCLPVEIAARQIVERSSQAGVLHLAHHRPRHWRECVLWMRLYGYNVRLIPYHSWLRQLEDEAGPTGDRAHPLRPLRSFFLHRPAGARGLTLPELMLEKNRRAFASPAAADADVCAEPALDAGLLQRYFDAFVESGVLPRTNRTAVPSSADMPDSGLFERALGARLSASRLLGRLSEHSIVSELTAWRSGRPTGLYRYELRIDDGRYRGVREVVVKVKPSDRVTIEVGEALARLCDERVGAAYARWAERIGFAAAHVRELALYEQSDPRFQRHTPAVLGTLSDPREGTWTIVLESVTNALLADSVDRPHEWTGSHIDCAIRGLAALQSIWYGREAELERQSWIGHVPTAAHVMEMNDLWSAIAAHAAPRFSVWADPSIAGILRRLIETVPRWWPQLEALPRTLVHNDFNPRNICLGTGADGPRLIAYDWELACVGAPQRDLAELLCFVLPEDVSDQEVDDWIERHREHLERATGAAIAQSDWRQGFRSALYDLMLNRLPMYALVHRIRHQPFLPRVVRTWRRLYERFPL